MLCFHATENIDECETHHTGKEVALVLQEHVEWEVHVDDEEKDGEVQQGRAGTPLTCPFLVAFARRSGREGRGHEGDRREFDGGPVPGEDGRGCSVM